PALGQVACHLRETLQGSPLVEDRRNDGIGPEPRSVLADAPALVFSASLPRRGGQLALRPAGGYVFGWVKDGDVPADDLGIGVTLDALPALVPTDDAAFGIEPEDGIVLHLLDQCPEPF